jgi:TRAP-type C4-dicarboxylate transport system permease small subunit
MALRSTLTRWLHSAEDALLGVLLLALVLLSSVQILRRTLFQNGWIGAEASARALVLWVALLGALAANREGRHVRIDLVEHWLPARLQGALARTATAVAALVCALLGWYGWQLVMLEQEMSETTFAGLPAWWVSLVIPFGFGLMALRFALQTVLGAPSPASVPEPEGDPARTSE